MWTAAAQQYLWGVRQMLLNAQIRPKKVPHKGGAPAEWGTLLGAARGCDCEKYNDKNRVRTGACARGCGGFADHTLGSLCNNGKQTRYEIDFTASTGGRERIWEYAGSLSERRTQQPSPAKRSAGDSGGPP